MLFARNVGVSMQQSKPKPGDIVKVTFLDHVEDGDTPLRCIVVGRLKYRGKVLSGKRFIVVESWFFDKEISVATSEANAKVFTILTSTVLSLTKLVEASNGVL